MVVTLDGIRTCVRLEQFAKAPNPIVATPAGITSCSKLEQSPIALTLDGILSRTKLEHLYKA
jgi:hypothetical protein